MLPNLSFGTREVPGPPWLSFRSPRGSFQSPARWVLGRSKPCPRPRVVQERNGSSSTPGMPSALLSLLHFLCLSLFLGARAEAGTGLSVLTEKMGRWRCVATAKGWPRRRAGQRVPASGGRLGATALSSAITRVVPSFRCDVQLHAQPELPLPAQPPPLLGQARHLLGGGCCSIHSRGGRRGARR